MELIPISMGDLKVHHLGTGGIVSIITFLVTNFVFITRDLDYTEMMWVNVGLIVLPIVFGINHKRKGKHVRESTGFCFLSGHGVVFTLILNYFQEELLQFVMNLQGQLI